MIHSVIIMPTWVPPYDMVLIRTFGSPKRGTGEMLVPESIAATPLFHTLPSSPSIPMTKCSNPHKSEYGESGKHLRYLLVVVADSLPPQSRLDHHVMVPTFCW